MSEELLLTEEYLVQLDQDVCADLETLTGMREDAQALARLLAGTPVADLARENIAKLTQYEHQLKVFQRALEALVEAGYPRLPVQVVEWPIYLRIEALLESAIRGFEEGFEPRWAVTAVVTAGEPVEQNDD